MKFHQRFGNYLQPFTNLVIKPLDWQEDDGMWYSVDNPFGYSILYDKEKDKYLNIGFSNWNDTLQQAKQFAEENYEKQVQSCLKWNFSFRDDVLMIWGCCAMILTFVLLTNIFAPSPRSEKKTISSEYNYRK